MAATSEALANHQIGGSGAEAIRPKEVADADTQQKVVVMCATIVDHTVTTEATSGVEGKDNQIILHHRSQIYGRQLSEAKVQR